MEDYLEMGYEDHNDILYEMFGVDNDEDLDEALDSWANDLCREDS